MTLVNNCLPTIETERLVLRTRELSDAADIFKFASLPVVADNAGFPAVQSIEEEVAYLKTLKATLLAENIPEGYGITLKGEDKIIGSVDFNHRLADDILEIGYILHPDYWGVGIMTEAVSALVDLGFSQLDLHKIEIACHSENLRSQSVIRKLGFIQESCLRDRRIVNGIRCHDLRFGLLKSEWKERNSK